MASRQSLKGAWKPQGGEMRLMLLRLLDKIREAGVIDEQRLAAELESDPDTVRRLIESLLEQGYVEPITKSSIDCRRCPLRRTCPGGRSRAHLPRTTFTAFRLTQAGMRYRRTLKAQTAK